MLLRTHVLKKEKTNISSMNNVIQNVKYVDEQMSLFLRNLLEQSLQRDKIMVLLYI